MRSAPHVLLQSLWPSAGVLGHQRWGLLRFFLMASAFNAALYFVVPQPQYDQRANLLAAGVFLVLLLLSYGQRGYALISHTGMLTGVVLMAYIGSQTGGINSPALVWMTIMAIPALLLGGRAWAHPWLAILLLVYVVGYVAVQQGWIDGRVLVSSGTMAWALIDKMLVLLSLMLVVYFYDDLQRQQMQQVSARNAELEATQKALRHAQSLKDEFIASVGHELRTPMNAILGLNDVLQTELADEPENVQIARHIGESTRQLLTLVNDILDFSQLEAGRLSLLEQPLVLKDLLDELRDSYAPRARQKGVQWQTMLDPQLPAGVMIDGLRLRQVLGNLLDNACKFTEQGSISLTVGEHQGMLRFEVQDSGRGIPKERQQEVFNLFEHVDQNTRRAFGGTGLGLALCERLVVLQGGRIGVSSQPGQGALFWLELPLHPCAVPEPPKAGGQAKAWTVLLVDDNPINLMVAQLVIQKTWPHGQVITANGGEQALQWLQSHRCDLVLMDMVMPGCDGPETTRRLRRDPRPDVAQLPVIGLTASTNAEDRAVCLQSGMSDVLTKPIQESALRQATQTLAQRKVREDTP
jgi:signal transduction histidine kinase/CheY-like chemotaxis protein